jgi:hypothetical protein
MDSALRRGLVRSLNEPVYPADPNRTALRSYEARCRISGYEGLQKGRYL